MRISWRERLAQSPGLRNVADWPTIPLDSLPRRRRKGFLRNRRIVAQALAGTPLGGVAAVHHVSNGRVSQLLTRCLGGDADAPPALTAGLVPFRTVAAKHRVSPYPDLRHARGANCAFQALLTEVPGLRAGFDAMIKAKLDDKNYAQRLTPQAFHGEFKRILAEQHWPQDRYPYTHASHAYDAVRRYGIQRTAELAAERARTRASVVPLAPAVVGRRQALRAIQIDEHPVDLQSRVHLMLNDDLIPLRLGRGTVLVAADVDMECTLGYLLVATRAPNQQDMLTLLERCLTPAPLPALTTPGLEYLPGAGFPCTLPNPFPLSFGTVCLDNAWLHKAHSVEDFFCRQMGATLNLGTPGKPKVRHLIESIFKYIEDHCGHRVPSTTGSHPTDPARESRNNRETPPTIAFHTVEEALGVVLSEDNVKPRAALGGASPLELFQYHCAQHFTRYVPTDRTAHWQPFLTELLLPVHWYAHEHRLPHVQFLYERYQGPGLLRIVGKLRKSYRIRCIFDRRDIRTLHAYTLDGEDLGLLYAPLPWQRYPHSVATRQHLHTHAKTYRLGRRDPMGDYFRWLLEHAGNPEVALSLLRAHTEFSGGHPQCLVLVEGAHAPATRVPSPISTGAATPGSRMVWQPAHTHLTR